MAFLCFRILKIQVFSIIIGFGWLHISMPNSHMEVRCLGTRGWNCWCQTQVARTLKSLPATLAWALPPKSQPHSWYPSYWMDEKNSGEHTGKIMNKTEWSYKQVQCHTCCPYEAATDPVIARRLWSHATACHKASSLLSRPCRTLTNTKAMPITENSSS